MGLDRRQAPYRAESRHHEQESAKSLARALDPARDNPPDEVAFSQERAIGNAPAANPSSSARDRGRSWRASTTSP
jgi:hypothetical protein